MLLEVFVLVFTFLFFLTSFLTVLFFFVSVVVVVDPVLGLTASFVSGLTAGLVSVSVPGFYLRP